MNVTVWMTKELPKRPVDSPRRSQPPSNFGNHKKRDAAFAKILHYFRSFPGEWAALQVSSAVEINLSSTSKYLAAMKDLNLLIVAKKRGGAFFYALPKSGANSH